MRQSTTSSFPEEMPLMCIKVSVWERGVKKTRVDQGLKMWGERSYKDAL